MTTTIELQPASEYRRNSYGILFESVKTYTIAGRDVHNSGSQHKIEVWFNRKPGIDPNGRSTTDQITVLTSAQAVMIAGTPVDRPERGGELRPGDEVELRGFGTYRVVTRWLCDPELVRVVE